MKVVDHEQWSWFLVADGDRLLLDVNCNYSAFGYSWLIALSRAEMERYKNEGKSYLNGLAQQVQYSVPGVKGSTSPFLERKLSREEEVLFHKTVTEWRSAQGLK